MIDGGAGNDYLQGGPGNNVSRRRRRRHHPAARPRPQRASGPATATTAWRPTAQAPSTIDCGPGGDRVNIGFNRNVKTVNCETVTKRYKN